MIEINAVSSRLAIQYVREAFAEAPFPRGASVARTGTSYDDEGRPHHYKDHEAQLVEKFFAARAWMEISGEELLRWRPANVSCYFLTPQAFAYYLPTYLIAFLTVPMDGVVCATLETFISCLTPPTPISGDNNPQTRAMDGELHENFEKFMSLLTSRQKTAVATCLEVFEPMFEEEYLENTVRTALDRCWRKFITH